MNLDQAVSMMKLKEQKPEATKKRKTDALTLAKDRVLLAEKEGRGFDGYSIDEVANLLFASSTFTLMELPLNKLALPGARIGNDLVRRITAEGVKKEPIVVDANVHKVGKSAKTGYYPPVIVVDGKERFEAAVQYGEDKIVAWVGNLAASKMDIRADHQLSSDELQSLLTQAIREDLNIKPTDYGSTFYMRQVYPMENYCIYSYKQTLWRQKYICDMDDRSCTLVGPPKEVVQKYLDKDASKGTISSAMALHACACQVKAKAGTTMHFKNKAGKVVTLENCITAYKAACKDGSFKASKDMSAVSPPGWGGTTRKMKEDHSDAIDNPYALSWWMKDQGYHSHIPDDKK